MPRFRKFLLGIISLSLLLVSANDFFGQVKSEVFRRTLTEKAGITAADLDRLAAGEAVVAAIETNDKQEVAVIGVVRVAPKRQLTIEDLRSSLSPRQNTEVGAVEKFSTPPRVEDLDRLRLTDDDIEELVKCEVGNCDLNLSESAIRRIREVAGRENGAIKDRLAQVVAQILLEHLSAYQKDGDSALGDYANRSKKVRLSDAHTKLHRDTLFLSEVVPTLNNALVSFPGRGQNDVVSEFFWSTVDFGLKPMITISHLTYYPAGSIASDVLAVATKQIYASRYLDASLTLALIFTVGDAEKKETFLVFTDRSRSDALEGMFGSFSRRVVKTEAIKRVEEIVTTARLRLELPSPPVSETQPETEKTTFFQKTRVFLQDPLVLIVLVAALLLGIFSLLRNRARQQR